MAAAKKRTAKKATAKKAATKQRTAAKKSVVKKSAVKKSAAKKTSAKKAAPPRALARYRAIIAIPRARALFAFVFVEGIIIFGVFPYIAPLLEARGAGGPSEAGIIVAAFAAPAHCLTARPSS